MTFNISRHSHRPDARLGSLKGGKGFWSYFVAGTVGRIRTGSLSVVMPDGTRIDSDAIHPELHAIIVIRDASAFRKLILGGAIGFAESYISGDWDSPDLSRLIEVLALNTETLAGRLSGSAPLRVANYLLHRFNRNSRRGSRNNIRHHYDLGNEFYAQWLDPDMIYSSAIFTSHAEDLGQAQGRKIDRIIELLDIREQQTVLEIGCGWGALARQIAERKKARVHGITLSTQQLQYAQNVARASHAQALISLDLSDYRDLRDPYDRIVSIEMIEAVGEEFLPKYFETIGERLKPGGRAVVQAITIDEKRFERYRSTPDFIQKYIFPGGFLTTRTMMHRYAEHAGLELCHAEYFGKSYARTLHEWRLRFNTNWPAISRLGYPEKFKNMWDYYLAYCEGGFNAGAIDVGLHVLKHKSRN